ncbi:lysophospholipid acyltransferase family protein [Bacillus sp. FJAT-44742]|uniref:lysophospholipid acyltransferase family protein n=1 Tax=Bacillus sp. FJAT-44742 TaxID=2014005 RepID=UPI000C243FE7|nr:lysophospholipid acyltransferase family protein [Bacillus sp. FJAT-44742]
MILYRIGKSLFTIFFSVVYRPKVIGKSNIPKEGPVVICSNHISNFDPPLIGTSIKRQINFMAKSELFDVKVLGPALDKIGVFPVKRGAGDRQALKLGIKYLKENRVLCLFPEGTRSKTGELGKGLAGAGFFALRSDAAVIPAVIIGPYKPFRRVKVVFGEPLDIQDLRENKGSAEQATERIMARIQSLLDEHNEGTSK